MYDERASLLAWQDYDDEDAAWNVACAYITRQLALFHNIPKFIDRLRESINIYAWVYSGGGDCW